MAGDLELIDLDGFFLEKLFPALDAVGGSVTVIDVCDGVSELPVATVGGNLLIKDKYAKEIYLDNLQEVQGTLEVGGGIIATLAIPSLKKVESINVLDSTGEIVVNKDLQWRETSYFNPSSREPCSLTHFNTLKFKDGFKC